MRLGTALLVLICGLFAAAASDANGPHRAVALAEADGPKYVQQAPNRVAAGAAALRACQKANPARAQACEIVELDELQIETAADIKARARGENLFLWQYQNGASTVYLAGSIHLLKPGFYPLAPQFEQAFAASDKLVVEVDTSQLDPVEIQRATMGYATLPEGQTLSGVLPAKTYARLASVMAQYGLPIAQFEQFKPALINQQLAVIAMMSLGYQAEAGVEHHFLSKNEHRPVLELETLTDQLDLLFNVPMATQIALTEDSLDVMPVFPTAMSALISAWLAGDDDGLLAALESQQGERPEVLAWNHRLLDQRNHGMAEKIHGYLKDSGSYFVLVGTAHLVGDNSIPALLEKMGYSGRRISTKDAI